MTKKIIAIVIAVIICVGGILMVLGDSLVFPTYEITESIKFAQSLGRGWNLGNTLEACEKFSDKKAGLETETMWGNPVTTKEMIKYRA